MQSRPLLDIGLGALLGSDKIADFLHTHLRRVGSSFEPEINLARFRSQCREELVQALDHAWPRRFRLNELQRVALHLCHDGLFESAELPALDQLFDSLMQRDGDWVHYQPRQVQAYARLAGELDPVLLVSWHLAQWLRDFSRPTPFDVQRVVNAQMPLFTPPPLANKPVADNHVHLNGIDGPDSLLAIHLLGRHGLHELSEQERPAALRLRRLLQWLMDEDGTIFQRPGTDIDLSPASRRHVQLQKILADDAALDLQWAPDWDLVAGQLRVETTVNAPWLQYQMLQAWADQRPARAWLWMHLWLWSCYRDSRTSPTRRIAIFYFMTQAMALRRKMIVDGQGLRRFTERYYGPALRWTAASRQENSYREPARRMLAASTDRAEIKFVPQNFTPATVKAFTKASCPLSEKAVAMQQFLQPADQPPGALEREHAQDMDKWHFCLHLLRADAAGGNSGKSPEFADMGLSRRRRRLELWDQVKSIQAGLRRTAGWNQAVFLHGFTRNGLAFSPSRWVRGLDVAGDESAWPIEFFAPQLRAMRQGLDKLDPGMPASRGFHFSIHAGEDYAHPLSGMRHTDETVLFCEMRDGDRLGHALALGIPPRQWFEGHGDVLIPVDEHLDNLVWAWHRATELAPRLELAGRVLPRLERRIERFLPHVSWRQPLRSNLLGAPGRQALAARNDGARADPAVLHRAWLLRRNCPALLEKEHPAAPMLDDRLLAAVPDLDRLLRFLRRAPGEAWDRAVEYFLDRAALEHEPTPAPRLVLIRADGQASLHRQESREWDPRHDDGELLHDHELPEEIDFMHALQDHLLARYACMGLWIETNPSSNVYIARLDTHAEHPIFRWSPPDEADLAPGKPFNRFGLRRGPMNVLVNTDDPGIMPTTLRMEFELLREAGMDLGYTRAQVEQWLEGIRRAGLEQFERNHLPVFELAA